MTVTEAVETPRLIELPREGYSLFYREATETASHAYQRVNEKGKPGIRYPGASTLGNAFPDSPRWRHYWTENKTLEGVARLSAAQIAVPDDPHVLKAILGQHELRWEQIRDSAADRGTRTHSLMLEALARGGDIPDLEVLPEDERGYGQAVFKWWQDRKPEPINVEQVVLSLEHNYAGRFDLRCTIDAPLEPCHGTGIVDLKTSAKGPYRSDHVQLRLYDMASRECGVGGSDWQMILMVDEHGDYRERYCCATENMARLAIESHHEANALERAMKAAA